MNTYEKAKEQLRKFADLEEGWDSYHAVRIDSDIIASAVRLLDQLEIMNFPAPQPIPCPQGEVQLEWHHGLLDIEIECCENDRFVLYAATDINGLKAALQSLLTPSEVITKFRLHPPEPHKKLNEQ